MIKKTRKWQNL